MQRNRGAPIGILGPMLERQETIQSLQDPGGLLSDTGEEHAPQAQSSARSTTNGRPQSSKQVEQQRLQGNDGAMKDDGPSTRAQATSWTLASTAAKAPQDTQSLPGHRPGADDMILHDPGGLLGAG
ncbi:hypothetical protein LTR12_017664 [Friedmanniomyces endolithicus]|nr:hypothetical protein LTR74_018466 [Friedmanniomyces endolithicus]KAK1807980.1 hypothetical protein LTR12_017664 [Friedmanniomyces endolithicus]